MTRVPGRHQRLQDDDFLGALWALTLPLFDPARLACLRANWMRPDPDDALDDEDGVFDGRRSGSRPFGFRSRALSGSGEGALLEGVPGARMRDYLIERFGAISDALPERLAEADGHAPTHPSIAVLCACAGLDEVEGRLLDFVEKKDSVAHFQIFLRETDLEATREHYACLAVALDVRADEVQARLYRHGSLSRLDLAKKTGGRSDLEDFVQASDLLEDILALEPSTSEALLAAVVEPAAALECPIDAFPHLAREAARLQSALFSAARTGSAGVNALFYGSPGCGKTQFASAAAQAAGLQAWQVKAANEDGFGLSRAGRLGAYQLVQRLLRGRSDCVVVFDEVEDAFGNPENALLAFFGGRPRAGKDKGWMNRLLEDNPLPAIWITNDIECMAPAFLRRSLLPVAFSTPPRRVRRQMAERHLGDTPVPAALLDELAADPALVPEDFLRRLIVECRYKEGMQAVA